MVTVTPFKLAAQVAKMTEERV